MATRTRFDSGIGLPDVDEGGDRPRGCEWHQSVCVDSPTHFIQWGAHGDESAELTTSVYCGRHYATELSYYIAFHVKDCPGTVLQHVSNFGKIES